MTCLSMIVLSISYAVVLLLQSGDGAYIINGKEVEPHSLPYMALLEDIEGKPACGGVLIHPKWVLTAAHCSLIKRVLLGVHSISKKEKDSWQIRQVEKQVTHPCFNPAEKVNDLMLLKLDKAVKLTQTVKLQPLPNIEIDPKPGTKCLVSGWGATKNPKPNTKQTMSDHLRAANVTVIDRVKCNSKEYYGFDPIITKSMICAGSEDNQTYDSCQGDSGGPLMCNGVLTGVVSFGKFCGLKTKPGVYSFISEEKIQWISKTTKKSGL